MFDLQQALDNRMKSLKGMKKEPGGPTPQQKDEIKRSLQRSDILDATGKLKEISLPESR